MVRITVLASLALSSTALSLGKLERHHKMAPQQQVKAEGILNRRSFASAVLAGAVATAAAPAFAASPIDGEYWDPFHPTGLRTVQVSGNTATLVGRDDFDGKEWKVPTYLARRGPYIAH